MVAFLIVTLNFDVCSCLVAVILASLHVERWKICYCYRVALLTMLCWLNQQLSTCVVVCNVSTSRVFWCYILFFLNLRLSLYLLVSWSWWDWPLTWLTNHRPSVLRYCWLGHLTRKIVSEMTHNVSSHSSGTLYHTWSFFGPGWSCVNCSRKLL